MTRFYFILAALAASQLALAQTAITSCGAMITTAGSYKLTGNISTTAPGDCLVIQAPHVSLNLNGFTIEGVRATGSSAVNATGRIAPKISNGNIRNFDIGVNLTNIDSGVVDGVTVVNASLGIGDTGTLSRGMVIRNSVVTGLGRVRGSTACLIRNVRVYELEVDTACVVLDNNIDRITAAGGGNVIHGNTAAIDIRVSSGGAVVTNNSTKDAVIQCSSVYVENAHRTKTIVTPPACVQANNSN